MTMTINNPEKIGIGTWDLDSHGTALADVEGLGFGWYYNWLAEALWDSSGGAAMLSSEFVPMVWGSSDVNSTSLEYIANSSAETLLGFNEPDHLPQANMSVDEALAFWPELMSTGKRLASPATTTEGAFGKDSWLGRFMEGAQEKGYQVDVAAIHYYTEDMDVDAFKADLESLYDAYGLPIWITEWALVDWNNPDRFTLEETAAFARDAIHMMDDLPFVERHAWFAAYEGGDNWFINTELFDSEGKLTAVGNVFANALNGDTGGDELTSDAGDDDLSGATGDDDLSGATGDDDLSGATGGEELGGDTAGDELSADGDSGVHLEGGPDDDTLIGGDGDDILVGNGGNNILRGGAGDDLLYGGPGDDKLYGGPGNDVLRGGDGNDVLRGGDGNDVLRGGSGDDKLYGGPGDDKLFGGPGDDRLFGGPGNDVLRGGPGNDVLRGGAGDDKLFGGPGDDMLFGGPGNDILRGGSGNNVLRGGDGDDRLIGGPGNDRLYGGPGNDILRGGAGDDWLSGGQGMDRFIFQPNGGNNRIADFDDGDLLDFTLFGFANKTAALDLAVQAGDDVLFRFEDGGSVRLHNYEIAQLGADDILV